MAIFTRLYTHPVSENGVEAVWEQKADVPFNELIVSWNALRPTLGKHLLSVSVKCGSWSDWMPYAEWGADSQKTFISEAAGSFARTYQDIIQISEDKAADAFRIKINSSGQADLSRFDSLHACASNLQHFDIYRPSELSAVRIPLSSLRSQMSLKHPRQNDLASPVSTAMAIDWLIKKRATDPIEFAAKVHDKTFDIYGNWILNVAESYTRLNGRYGCRVERLQDFSALHQFLMKGLPVVVSLKGPIPNAPFPFNTGHLLLVVGWDPVEQRVYCADPAHATDDATLTFYNIEDFLAAWARRRNLSYVFFPKN